MVQATRKIFIFFTATFSSVTLGYAALSARATNDCVVNGTQPIVLFAGKITNTASPGLDLFNKTLGLPFELFPKPLNASWNPETLPGKFSDYVLTACLEGNCDNSTLFSHDWTLNNGTLLPRVHPPSTMEDLIISANGDLTFRVWEQPHTGSRQRYCIIPYPFARAGVLVAYPTYPRLWLCEDPSLTIDNSQAPIRRAVRAYPTNSENCTRIELIAWDPPEPAAP